MKTRFIFHARDDLTKTGAEKGIFNFQNLYSVWLFNKNILFKKQILKSGNINFPDGKILSFFLRTPQIRGPTFTKEKLMNEESKKEKHFFIGNLDLKKLSVISNIPVSKLESYNPPMIEGNEFPPNEIKKIVSKIKEFKPDNVWVGIGNPKQEILSNQLFEIFPGKYFNVGAGLDFFMCKKKEAPLFFRRLGLEWFYRLVTDFKHSWKKVWRSFIALFYLNSVGVRG
jgi:N-acetylglucosaminyldiphosphoundecaprenol N-acetyl-beta-D-mannosaminyltransferase